MRNAEFDQEHVLRAAMRAFMVKGYSKTSMQDLTKATGLHPGSIYCAFDNKKGLLLAAIGQYQQDRNEQFAACFSSKDSPLVNLKRYLDGVVQECLSCDATQACLLTKVLSELGDQDNDVRELIQNNLQGWQHAIEQVFDEAKALSLIDNSANSAQLAQYLMMGIYGLRTFGHTHPNIDVLKPLAEKLYQDVTTA